MTSKSGWDTRRFRITFDRYGHLFPELDEQVAEGLDVLLGELDLLHRPLRHGGAARQHDCRDLPAGASGRPVRGRGHRSAGGRKAGEAGESARREPDGES